VNPKTIQEPYLLSTSLPSSSQPMTSMKILSGMKSIGLMRMLTGWNGWGKSFVQLERGEEQLLAT